MKDIEFEAVYNALNVLNLPKKISINDIKKYYHKLSLKYHPDKCPDKSCKEKMASVTKAYKLLMKFFENYEFDLSELKSEQEKDNNYQRRFFYDFFEMKKDKK